MTKYLIFFLCVVLLPVNKSATTPNIAFHDDKYYKINIHGVYMRDMRSISSGIYNCIYLLGVQHQKDKHTIGQRCEHDKYVTFVHHYF